MKKVCTVLCVGICLMTTGVLQAGSLANFDDLSLAANSYWNGSDNSGGFTSGEAHFNNSYYDDGTYTYWDGFAYSNKSDKTTEGYTNQYSAITGAAHSGSNYGIAYAGLPTITFDNACVVSGISVTNTTYAALDMLNGNLYGFSKKFGGETLDDPDWFLLTITGKNAQGTVTDTVDFYLADFRFADNGQDYIVNTWQYVDLSSLGTVKSIEFALSSSDNSNGYMNTPAYFAIDTVVPEPSTMALIGIGMMLIRKRK